MPHRCPAHPARRSLLAKDSDAERAARETFIEQFVAVLREWHGTLLDALSDGDLIIVADAAARRTVARTLEAYAEDILTSYTTLYEGAAEAGRAVAIRRYDLDVNPLLEDQLVRELQQYAAETSEAIQGRMTRDIAQALRDAHDEGFGIPELERILEEEVFPEMRGYEAERAARTEGTAAAGRGAVSSYRDAGAAGKEWLAEDGPRTRPSHRAADGQVVPIGAQFDVDGHAAWWPGDPRLPIGERANCRCGVGPVWEL